MQYGSCTRPLIGASRLVVFLVLVAALGVATAQQADLEIQMWNGSGGTVLAGEQMTYYIVVTNWGPDTASNVEIRDQLATSTDDSFDPNGCSIAIRSTGGSITSFDCNFALSTGIFELGRFGSDSLVPIAPMYDPGDPSTPIEGNQAQVIITINGTAREAMTLTNHATVVSDTTDPDTSNNTATDFLEVEAVSDLALAVGGATSAPVVAGDDVGFRLDVTNGGPSAALGATFEASLPEGVVDATGDVRFDDGTDAPGSCTVAPAQTDGSTLTCALAEIPGVDDPDGATPHDDRVRFVDMRLTIASERTDPVSVSTMVQSESTDILGGNDRVRLSVPVDVASDLNVGVEGPTSIATGSDTTFTVRLTNGGPSLARSARISVTVPKGLSVTAGTVVDVDPQSCVVSSETHASDTVTCPLADVAAGSYDERLVKVAASLSRHVVPETELTATVTATANGGGDIATASHVAVAAEGTGLIVAPGANTPDGAVQARPGDGDTPIMQLAMERADDATTTTVIDGFTLVANSATVRTASLTPSAVALGDVADVHLYPDADGDGKVASGQAPVAEATSIDTVNGVIEVSATEELTLAPGEAATYLVTLDLAGNVATGGGFALAILALPFALGLGRGRTRLAAIMLLTAIALALTACSGGGSSATTEVTLETRLTSVHARAAGQATEMSVSGLPLQGRTVVVSHTAR